MKSMVRKGKFKGPHGYPHSTSVKLETIFEDEIPSKPKRAKRIKQSGPRRLFLRRWRIRIPKLKVVRIISPSKVLKKLQDAYVRMLLSLESKVGYGCSALVIRNQVVHPAVMAGRIIHHQNEDHELSLAGLRP